ncbi:PilZ domain-containing protein [Allohahella marinimesophila]|uniref:PilZ domain-containing protein n=2 Tax=Allohahella marinimesophila TaxID=1054972 RepID=A0ABP7PU10_9GAMM
MQNSMQDDGENMSEDRRNFKRIEFDAEVLIRHFDSTRDYIGTCWEAELVDVSFKGLLVSKPVDWDGSAHQYLLVLSLPDSDRAIEMIGHCSHETDELIGFVCDQISIESATNLRRLIELNVGDPFLLQREFASLIDYYKQTE